MTPAVADALSGFVAWMKKDALPLWLERGLHVPGDWYSDSLSREGTPGADVSIRLLAQAQMIYVISRAEQLGWVSKKHKTVRRLIEFSGTHAKLSRASNAAPVKV